MMMSAQPGTTGWLHSNWAFIVAPAMPTLYVAALILWGLSWPMMLPPVALAGLLLYLRYRKEAFHRRHTSAFAHAAFISNIGPAAALVKSEWFSIEWVYGSSVATVAFTLAACFFGWLEFRIQQPTSAHDKPTTYPALDAHTSFQNVQFGNNATVNIHPPGAAGNSLSSEPPADDYRSESNSEKAKSRHDRVVRNLDLLLRGLPTAVMDDFIETAERSIVIGEIFHFFYEFSERLDAGHFHLYDKELLKRANSLKDAWHGSLDFGEHALPLRSEREAYRVDPHPSTGGRTDESIRIENEFFEALEATRTAYHQLLRWIKDEYEEIDLLETSASAIKLYSEYMSQWDKK